MRYTRLNLNSGVLFQHFHTGQHPNAVHVTADRLNGDGPRRRRVQFPLNPIRQHVEQSPVSAVEYGHGIAERQNLFCADLGSCCALGQEENGGADGLGASQSTADEGL